MSTFERIAAIGAAQGVKADLTGAIEVGIGRLVGALPDNPELYVLVQWLSLWRPDVAAEFVACQRNRVGQ